MKKKQTDTLVLIMLNIPPLMLSFERQYVGRLKM
jgi:hypothetical protein